MLNVVILAGATRRGDLEIMEKVENKAYIKIEGRTMIEIIMGTLREVPEIEDIIVVGMPDELEKLNIDRYRFQSVAPRGSFLDNIAAGLGELDPYMPCLVVSADIPLLSRGSLEDLMERCSPYEHDFYYPIITRESCEESYPGVKRTYVQLKEGTFTGSNVMMTKPYWILEQIDDIEVYLSYRKNPWKLVQTLPLIYIIKFLIKRLSIKELESYLSGLFKVKARAIVTPYAELGVDVDKPSDLELVRKLLSAKN
ncbi:MAG: NTP transferase domain-containing protein [Firmicutes bacterium]|nr:NTP transferase domain-containing protein [Bacillota bacterium]